MSKLKDYIIVGRKVDGGGTKYLHSDGKINANASENGNLGEALDVEFIGKKVVELSRRGELSPGNMDYQTYAEHIRQAMVVQPLDETHAQDDPQIEDIHDRLQLNMVWDTRKPDDEGVDVNKRTIAIPVEDTLAYREDYFKNEANEPGFRPPLTYTLDLLMMKAFFDKILSETLEDLTGVSLPEDTKEAIKAELNKKWSEETFIHTVLKPEAEEVDPMRKSMARIVSSPLSAFHRAVGIYITNMCD